MDRADQVLRLDHEQACILYQDHACLHTQYDDRLLGGRPRYLEGELFPGQGRGCGVFRFSHIYIMVKSGGRRIPSNSDRNWPTFRGHRAHLQQASWPLPTAVGLDQKAADRRTKQARWHATSGPVLMQRSSPCHPTHRRLPVFRHPTHTHSSRPGVGRSTMIDRPRQDTPRTRRCRQSPPPTVRTTPKTFCAALLLRRSPRRHRPECKPA